MPVLDGRLFDAASLLTLGLHTMAKGHARSYDLEPVYQWRSALNRHTNAESMETIFSCG